MKNQEKHGWQDLSEEELEALAHASPEFPPLSDEDLAAAVAVSASGRIKVPVSIRLDQEVVEFFKARGPGYQSRINAVLLQHIRNEQQQPASASERLKIEGDLEEAIT